MGFATDRGWGAANSLRWAELGGVQGFEVVKSGPPGLVKKLCSRMHAPSYARVPRTAIPRRSPATPLPLTGRGSHDLQTPRSGSAVVLRMRQRASQPGTRDL